MPTLNHEAFRLEDQVAVVTGASRGIGEAIARTFAAQGATVVLVSRKQVDLETVAASIEQAGGGRAVPMACHTGDVEAIGALFTRIDEQLGRVDVLVNNAATNPYFGPVRGLTEPAFDKTVEVNVKGYLYMCQQAAARMVPRGRGSIVNIASMLGLTPAEGQVIYSMTKAAVINMTKGLAKELGPKGVRVNAIAPGLIETRFASALIDNQALHEQIVGATPLRRHGQPEEIAGAALFLASDAGSFTTGSVLVCDGGATA